MKSKQRGMSFVSVIVVGAVLVFGGVLAAQVFPTFLEYQAIGKAAQKAKEGATVADVRRIFDKASEVDDFKAITGRDLDVTKEGDKIVVSFAYNKEINITGSVFLLIKYSGRSK
jgi:Domain of unknown function (DUF4845)